MLSIRTLTGTVWLTTFSLFGCIDEEVTERAGDSQSSTHATPVTTKKAASFQMTWSAPSDFSPTQAAFRVAQIVLNRSLDASSFQTSYARPDIGARRASDSNVWDEAPLADDRQLHVKYYPSFNDLRISNRRLQDIVDGPDVGPERAWHRFVVAFDSLVQSDLIRAEHYDLSTAKKSLTKFAGGSSDPKADAPVPVITEYVFTVLRRLNGIPIANAGTRVAVHRSGDISSIRLGGVTVATSTEKRQPGLETSPTSDGRVFEFATTGEAADQRFAADFPLAKVEWSSMMYVMPDEADIAIVEPKHVVSYSNRTIVDGQPLAERRQMAAYSLREAALSVEQIGEKPTPDEVGDAR